MASRQPAWCSFWAIAHAMLRLLARPKITAVFCDSAIRVSPKIVILRFAQDDNILSLRDMAKCDETPSQFLSWNTAAPPAGRADSSSDNRFLPAHPAAIPFSIVRAACSP